MQERRLIDGPRHAAFLPDLRRRFLEWARCTFGSAALLSPAFVLARVLVWRLCVVAWSLPATASRPGGAGPVDYASQVKPILTPALRVLSRARPSRGRAAAGHGRGGLSRGQERAGRVAGQGRGEPADRGRARRRRRPIACRSIGRRWPQAEIKLLEAWIDQGAKAMPGEQPGVPPEQVALGVRPARRSRPSRRSHRRAGRATRSTASSWPRLEARRPVAVAGSRSAHLDPPAQPRPDRLAAVARGGRRLPGRPARPALSSAPSIGCWPRPISASGGRASGSTRPAMPTPTATTSMPPARSGSIATGSSPPSTPTCRSTSSRSTRSPATFAPGDDFGPRIATGFHRNTLINQEGGIDVEQFRVESIVDRVNTTGHGLPRADGRLCQCHDHKYDPISQREYYQLFAFFNNVDEPDLEIATPAELGPATGGPRRDRRAPPGTWPRSIPTSMSASSAGKRR